MKRPMLIAGGVACALLTGCADNAYGPDTGIVEGVGADDRVALVTPIEAMVRETIKPEAGTLAIANPSTDELIGPQLRADLARQGYQIVAPGDQAQHRLGYIVQMADGQYLVRVFLDSRDGAQLYARNAAGQLQALGPMVAGGGA